MDDKIDNYTSLYLVGVGYPGQRRIGVTIRCQRPGCQHPGEVSRQKITYQDSEEYGKTCSICKRRIREKPLKQKGLQP